MNLTAGQESALQCIRNLQVSHPTGGGLGVISGYAGTGKTTLLRILAEEYEDLLVLAPTGKAAVRVREASGARSKTIHSWMYEAKEDPKTGALSWGLKDSGTMEIPHCGLLVVDEASMVTLQLFLHLYEKIREVGLNLILVGDGFQLPPVESDPRRKDFSVFASDMPANFRIHLTEIHRQALDSPIVRASMQIRSGQWATEALGELPAIPETALMTESFRLFEDGGVTICHKNTTRHELNTGIRAIYGHPDQQLQIGEPLLVTQNNYALEVYNGEIVEVRTTPKPINLAPVAVRDAHTGASTHVNFLQLEADLPMCGVRMVCVADKEVFGTLGNVGGHVVRRTAKKLLERESEDKRTEAVEFVQANLGYALTCHKSQGSEFPMGIVVIEPSLRLNSDDGRRWAYTALTRFKRLVKICWKT